LRATYGAFQIKKSVPAAQTKGIVSSSEAAINFNAAQQP
jgi:hypothetical protein